MADLRYDASFPGADLDPWPTAYTPSVTTTGVANLLGNGLRATTGNVGGQTDFVRGILNDAAVNGVADLGVTGQFDFSSASPLPPCSWRFHLRSSGDWSGGGGARPSTSVRFVFATGTDPGDASNMRIEHTLSGGTLRVDATATYSPVVGRSQLFAFEVEGDVFRAKWWDSFGAAPTTGGPDGDGWLLKATQSVDKVTAGGRFQVILVGPTTAGAVNGYGRIRNLRYYTVGGVVIPPPPPPANTGLFAPLSSWGRRR